MERKGLTVAHKENAFRNGASAFSRTRDFQQHLLAVIIRDEEETTAMPSKVVETPYPLIDADPHASRVISYFRPSDYAVWLGATGAFPAALYFWGMFPLVISSSTFSCLCRNGRSH
jgi:hypothetical protein